jgi:hypothetical protein
MAGEQVGVTQPPARQRALQKLDALGLRGKISKRHAAVWRKIYRGSRMERGVDA